MRLKVIGKNKINEKNYVEFLNAFLNIKKLNSEFEWIKIKLRDIIYPDYAIKHA